MKGAQKPAFSEIEVTVQLTHNINKTTFHNYWKIENGFNVSYKTPFYIGDLLVGGSYLPYKSKIHSKPNYQSYFIFSGWLYNLNILNIIKLSPGIKFGNYLMNFEIILEDNEKFESEICLEYFCNLQYQINSSTNLNFEISKETVYTYKPLKFIFIKAGIGLKIEKPKWFEGFFK